MPSSEAEPDAPIPRVMRAWVRQYRGDYKQSLKLVEDFPTPPIPGPDSSDVVIRVAYVALEYSIVHFMSVFPALPFAPPLVPELAVSGTIVAAGGRAPEALRRHGTRILGSSDPLSMMLHGAGALKEYVRLPESAVLPLSDAAPISLATGAGLINSGVTALALVKTAKVESGQRILVNGASGSVGHIAVQLCRQRGAFVVGVASGANESLVRGLGADEVWLCRV